MIFNVRALKSIQTDFGKPEPYQKVVRISPDGKVMATGGDDGVVRVWTFPDLNPVHENRAHDKEIDDLDFSPDNTKIASISKDRQVFSDALVACQPNLIAICTGGLWCGM